MARSDDNLTALPDYASLKKAPSKARTIQLLTEAHQLRKVTAEAADRLTEIKSELTQIQILNDLPGLRYNQFCFMAVERTGRRTLSKEKLIDNGVEPEVIEASYAEGDPYMQCELQVIGEAAEKKAAKVAGEGRY